jgi:hypothetical protein
MRIDVLWFRHCDRGASRGCPRPSSASRWCCTRTRPLPASGCRMRPWPQNTKRRWPIRAVEGRVASVRSFSLPLAALWLDAVTLAAVWPAFLPGVDEWPPAQHDLAALWSLQWAMQCHLSRSFEPVRPPLEKRVSHPRRQRPEARACRLNGESKLNAYSRCAWARAASGCRLVSGSSSSSSKGGLITTTRTT